MLDCSSHLSEDLSTKYAEKDIFGVAVVELAIRTANLTFKYIRQYHSPERQMHLQQQLFYSAMQL